MDAVIRPGKTGQFEVIADGETVARRGGSWLSLRFGAGYPDLDGVVKELQKRRG